MTAPTAPATGLPDFPPTLREVMLRPRWIAMLGLCLVVAGVFAWLGQWQLGRALAETPQAPGATEQVVPLQDVARPGAYISDPVIGQRVEASGHWIPGDFIVLSSRYNERVPGYWVTGQLRLDAASGATGPTSLAVAVGWTPDRAVADEAAATLEAAASARHEASVTVTGRLIADEGATTPPRGADPAELTRMSPAALLSRWHDIDELDVYRGFVTTADPLAGLTAIASPAPVERGVNWLNVFYAAEWAVFCAFAFYLWYRLAKDAWEKELEAREERLERASGAEG